MSGIEVVAAVAGIVSAFQASVTLYRSWRDRRIGRRGLLENQRLEDSLSQGAVAVRTEYDRDFARLGERFAVGDAIGQAALSRYVIQLQQTIITLLCDPDTLQDVLMPHLGNTLGSSDNIRKGAVNALASQYQRMMQSVSPSRALKPYSRGPVVDALASMRQRMMRSPSSSHAVNRYGRGGGVISSPETFSSNTSRSTRLSTPSHAQAPGNNTSQSNFRDPDPRIPEHEFGPHTQPRLRIPWKTRFWHRWYSNGMCLSFSIKLDDIARKFHLRQPYTGEVVENA